MLLKIELENFFSIKNRIFLDFIAANATADRQEIYPTMSLTGMGRKY